MSVPEITVDQLDEARGAGAFVLDVRNPEELAEAHVPGVVPLPLPELESRADEVPSDGTVYVICRSGARSAQAVEFLRSRGVDAVNVAGGTMAWIDSGRGVDSGPDA